MMTEDGLYALPHTIIPEVRLNLPADGARKLTLGIDWLIKFQERGMWLDYLR